MGKKKKKAWGHDPVYLVILAIGIGLGFSIGMATDSVVWGLSIGAVVGVIGCVAYFFIKKALQPKKTKPRSKYRL
ncbi:hypothetical protein KAH81_03760 [bacterium]|nr:hypothetical protein [bacterium]